MKKFKGFTLVEILVVVFIIGLLASIAIAVYSNTKAQSRDARRRSDAKTIQNAAESYLAINHNYPGYKAGPNNDKLERSRYPSGNNADFLSPLIPNFLPRLIMDPTNSTDYHYGYASTINRNDPDNPVIEPDKDIFGPGGDQACKEPAVYRFIHHPGYFILVYQLEQDTANGCDYRYKKKSYVLSSPATTF